MVPLGFRRHRRSVVNLVLFTVVLLSMPMQALSRGDLDLPVLPPPEEYGNIVINRLSAEKDVMPVLFSHWAHRTNYTCRVCHVELEFSMKANDTGIVCNGGEMTGKYCTVCHNGKTAFAPRGKEGENCDRCHNAFSDPDRARFAELKKKLPAAKFGNEIDWGKALANGLIKPKKSLSNSFSPIVVDRTLLLEAEMAGIAPAVFPHKAHSEWLDCNICHPDIFNLKKKTTKHFSMWRILNKEFCGVCHLNIAFPVNDCKRCHPTMRK